MNNCGKCNAEIVPNSNYCQSCGSKLGAVEPPANNIQMTQSSDSYLERIIYTKSLRRLYLGLSLVGVACLIFLSQYNYIQNVISGPRLIDSQTLESELSSGDIKDININLRLSQNGVYPAGYTHITKTVDSATNQVESETTDSEYYLTIIGRHVLVLEGDQNQTPTGNFVGVVTPMPLDLQSKLASDFSKVPELAGLSRSILPYALSNKGMTSLDGAGILLFGFAALCCGAYFVVITMFNPKDRKHYAYKIPSLAGYESMLDLSRDFAQSKKAGTLNIGGYVLSSKFLFKESFFHFSIFPMSRMSWAYKKQIKKSVNFIPTGTRYEIVMHFPKQVVAIKEFEESVNQHLVLLATRYPEAKFGYK